ncbi:MAG TPA: ribosome maturation factor RimP [bacterium]|jgi:ribosome maturation factor RimP|nr:ribosome maturation factor RimP [Myxococcales bacterium]OQA61591.1 MAG: Ribosome maturation factor RimP [bacterium ADurb.Bin270]HPW45810.1 ribosome maturation factor RimP [bacterium]
MDSAVILTKIEDLVSPVLANLGYELVDREFAVEGGRRILRIYIDRPGGVTIDDCSAASHAVEDLIEVEELIPEKYVLEISSPGINRPLRKREDFERYAGSIVRMKTRNPVGGRSNFKGELVGLSGDDVVVTIDGKNYNVPIAELGKARIDEDPFKSQKKGTKWKCNAGG